MPEQEGGSVSSSANAASGLLTNANLGIGTALAASRSANAITKRTVVFDEVQTDLKIEASGMGDVITVVMRL